MCFGQKWPPELQHRGRKEPQGHGGGEGITREKRSSLTSFPSTGNVAAGKEVAESEAVTLPVYAGLLSVAATGRAGLLLLPGCLSCLLQCLLYSDRLYPSRTMNHISPFLLSVLCCTGNWWCLSPLSSVALVMVFYLSQQAETKLVFPFVVRSNNSYPPASCFLTARKALILARRALRLWLFCFCLDWLSYSVCF